MKDSTVHYMVGLGGNLGDRAGNLARALEAMGRLPDTRIMAVSPAFETTPVGYGDQPDFINLCAALSSEINPEEMLKATLAIEARSGRERTANRNGPRTLDIDLLFHRDGEHASATLTLPHPRWKSRGFVVIPLKHLLDEPVIVKDPAWDSLRAEVTGLEADTSGLRPWQGPTPWIKKKD